MLKKSTCYPYKCIPIILFLYSLSKNYTMYCSREHESLEVMGSLLVLDLRLALRLSQLTAPCSLQHVATLDFWATM